MTNTCKIYNEDCFITMQKMCENGEHPNIILTSPFYNTNKKANNSVLNDKNKSYVRYDEHIDNYTEEQYRNFMIDLFNKYDKVLAWGGVVLFNLSYGSQNTTSMWLVISDVIQKTAFTVADCIVWKKKSAIPNNMSCNKLTRIVEYIFVLCRKTEFYNFQCNKQIVSKRASGQNIYENILNFIEADNNDEPCSFNKATFSSDLCRQLLKIYAKSENDLIYDSFMGTGTTGLACKQMGLNFIGSEISKRQCEYAKNRIEQYNF